MMNKSRCRIVLAALMFGVLALIVNSVEAQDKSQEAAVEAHDLFAEVEEKGQELVGTLEQARLAGGEDADALHTRAAELVEEIVSRVNELAANVKDREEDGQDARADRDRVADMLDKTTHFLQQSAAETQDKIRQLKKRAKDASVEERETIDAELVAENEWYENVLTLLLEQVQQAEDFGLDVQGKRQFLVDTAEQRAELLAGRIMLRRDEVARIERQLSADPTNTELTTILETVKHRLDLNVSRLENMAQFMKTLGLESAEYDQLLFEVTGEITTSLFSKEVLAGLMAKWRDAGIDGITSNGPSLILNVVLFVLILLVFRFLARVAKKVVAKALRTSSLEVSVLLERTAMSVTGSVIMIFGFLVALSQLGVEVGPMLAGLGVAGFIIGFALQDTLGNFAAGAMILFYRPYDVGDLVETAGAFGKVKDMSLVSTTILTLDHQTLVIPNNKIWGDVIKNVTAQKKRRVDMVFGIGYADDIPQAEKVLKEILDGHEKVLDDPEPVVKLHTLGESSVDFIVRPWAATDDYWDVYWDITREVKIRFDAEGISIPFPQRDVHLFQENGTGGGV